MSVYRSRVMIGALAMGLLLAGCGAGPEKTKPTDSSLKSNIPIAKEFDPNATFIWANPYGTTSWDPIHTTTGGDRDLLIPVYDRLVYSDAVGELEPMLAESWDAGADGLSLTVKLRPNLTFSDGAPFDADAVKFNLDRARGADSKIKNEVAMVADVQVVDPLTVKFIVNGELGAFLSALANKPGMMVSPQAAAAGGLDATPVGIGPYLATEILPGDKVTYSKTPNYWDPSAQNVATMEFVIMPDEQTRYNALQSGEIHGAPLNPNQVGAATRAGIKVVSGPSPIFAYLAVNNSVAPFDNVKVREALNYAIDREAIGAGLYEGFCKPQIQPWPESSFAYSEDIGPGLDVFPYDPEKAKALLKEAGYANGFEVELMTTNLTGYMKLGEVVQSQLDAVGIKVKITSVPPPQFIESFSVNKSVPMVVNGYPGAPDPDDVYKRLLAPKSVVNPGGALPQQVTDLAAAAAAPLDPAERAPIYESLMEQLIEEPTNLVTICMQQASEGYADEVSNVAVYVNGAREKRGVAIS